MKVDSLYGTISKPSGAVAGPNLEGTGPDGRRALSTRFPDIGVDSRDGAWNKGLKDDIIKGIHQKRTASTHALLGQASCDDPEVRLVEWRA